MAIENDNSFRYLIVRPENSGITDLLRYGISGNKAIGAKFLESSDDQILHEQLSPADIHGRVTPDHRWVIIVSIIMRKLIKFLGKPMAWTGYIVDFVLNLLFLNGNLLGLVCNVLRGKIVIPARGSATFISTIGHIDGRIEVESGDVYEGLDVGSKSLMDLCMMASKLAYENEIVIKNVVNLHWKMHFIDFYNCLNEYQKERSTQVFIFSDKPTNANLIMISFRGTEPFDADDWITDFDYSWYEIPKVGKIHMGFLEAMGLGNRSNPPSFQQLIQKTNKMIQSSDDSDPSLYTSAYFVALEKLKKLLKEDHKNAKFMVTGHSLGGALAILFPTMLILHEEEEILERLLGVHTFGQPRVGNRELGRFIESRLQEPNPRYYRVVYCNDLVPRLPYDNKAFLYKHFGVCLYYDGFYVEQKVDEEPNRNYYGLWYLIPEHLNALWELMRGMGMGFIYGKEYKESWVSIFMRIIGLAFPGVSAHAPPNYINSIRLGTQNHHHFHT